MLGTRSCDMNRQISRFSDWCRINLRHSLATTELDLPSTGGGSLPDATADPKVYICDEMAVTSPTPRHPFAETMLHLRTVATGIQMHGR